jgi:hypothetical protein
VGSPFSGAEPRLKVNDGTCPEKPDHLRTGDTGTHISLTPKANTPKAEIAKIALLSSGELVESCIRIFN